MDERPVSRVSNALWLIFLLPPYFRQRKFIASTGTVPYPIADLEEISVYELQSFLPRKLTSSGRMSCPVLVGQGKRVSAFGAYTPPSYPGIQLLNSLLTSWHISTVSSSPPLQFLDPVQTAEFESMQAPSAHLKNFPSWYPTFSLQSSKQDPRLWSI